MVGEIGVKPPNQIFRYRGFADGPEGLGANSGVTAGDDQEGRLHMQGVALELCHAFCCVMVNMRPRSQPEMLISRWAGHVFQRADTKIHIGARLGVYVGRKRNKLFYLV